MAQEWREVISGRQERAKIHRSFVDGAATDSYACDAVIGRLHYPGVLDSGVQDTEIDCTPVRVDTPQFDGWRVTQNSWHYALGKDLANHGNEDGWVGFGGRQGAHFFKFRLLRLGYLHWPTRAWQDIGGAPTYDRGNLSQTVGHIEFPVVGASVPVGTTATWESIWQTPGGGRLDVSWGADGYRLKEEITINQAGRAWIAANRPPSTLPTETWFGFVIELDWSDIPRIYRAGVLKQASDDFADDGEDIALRDAVNRLLAFLPVSEAYVEVAPGQRETVALRKRFYTDAGRHYLLVGARVPELNAMPAGDLVFDPTINYQVGASVDDGQEEDRVFMDDANIYHSCGDWLGSVYDSGNRWLGVTITVGAVIDVAYVTFYPASDDSGAVNYSYFGEDNATPLDFDLNRLISLRTKTTAFVNENPPANWTTHTPINSPGLETIVQELVDTYDYSGGRNMVIFRWLNSGGGERIAESYDWPATGPANAAKLHIEYTAAVIVPGGDAGMGVVGPGAGGQLGGVQSTDHGPVGPGGVLWP